LAHAFLWEYSDARLKLAQLLGQLGGFLTFARAPLLVALVVKSTISSSCPPSRHGSFRRSAAGVGPDWLVPLQPSELQAAYHLPSVSFHGRGGS
jgi:hypothetical protein